MPYLKSSQITGLSPKPIDVTGFTQSATEDLEGTYSQHEVLLADAFNITDNVTISDNLILAKLSDDGEAITLTGNATTTRTISGSGSLEGSTFAQTPNASMTGMTGTIGSAVTNNAGVASGSIASAVTGYTGIKNSSHWKLDTGFSGNVDPITFPTEVVAMGPSMSQSAGIFSFPSTGYWLMRYHMNPTLNGDARHAHIRIYATTNNQSSFPYVAYAYCFIQQTAGSTTQTHVNVEYIFDVTNVTTHKVKFGTANCSNASIYFEAAGSGVTGSGVTFTRLGDT